MENKPTDVQDAQVVEAPVQKKYSFTEEQVNVLLNSIAELPWKQANPIIKFLQENLQEIK